MISYQRFCGNFTSFKMILKCVNIKMLEQILNFNEKRFNFNETYKKIKRNFTYSGQVQSNYFCYLGCYLRNKFSINFKKLYFYKALW